MYETTQSANPFIGKNSRDMGRAVIDSNEDGSFTITVNPVNRARDAEGKVLFSGKLESYPKSYASFDALVDSAAASSGIPRAQIESFFTTLISLFWSIETEAKTPEVINAPEL